ncbi:MAG: PAS domain-containing protein [Hyphomicrobium sp.]
MKTRSKWQIVSSLSRLGRQFYGWPSFGALSEQMKFNADGSRARMQQMLSASPAVIYATEACGDFRCTFVSSNLRTVIGYAPDEMTTDPKHWPHNLHPQDAAKVIDKVAALIEHGGGTVEYRFRHRDGHYIWIQDSFKVARDANGKPTELVGAWADISERKLAQDMLQRAYDDLEKRVDSRTEELKEGQERLRYVLAVSPAITYVTKATGDFACTFASESSRQIMGYSPSEMLAAQNFWLEHLHPQDAPKVLAEFTRLISQGGGNLEYRFLHKGGHYRWFQDTFQVLPNEKGEPEEIVGSWADITHRKLAEAVRELYGASLDRQQPAAPEKLDMILETGREVLNLDRLSILRADAQNDWLQAVATTGMQDPREAIRIPIGLEGGGLALALQTNSMVVCDGSEPVPQRLRLHPPYDQIKSLRSRVFAIIPLIIQGQSVGVLVADRKFNRVPFEPATLEALQSLASQAAIGLEQSRIYAAAQPVLTRSLNLSVVYPAFARAVQALLPYHRIGVVVPEGKSLVMALSAAEPPLATWQGQTWEHIEGTSVEWVLKTGTPRVVRDMSEEQEFTDSSFIAAEGVRANIMVPLMAGGAPVGVFFLDSLTPGAYTEQDVELINPVAQQLALAIDNTRMFQEIEQKSQKLSRSLEEMKVLREIGQALNSTLDPETVLLSIIVDAVQLSGADGGAIYQFDEATQCLIMGATHNLDDKLVRSLRENPVRLGEGSVGHAASTRAPYDVADVQGGQYESRLRNVVAQSGYRAILSVPLMRDDRVFGGLSLFRKKAGVSSPEIVDLLQTFATQSMLAIANARQFQEIEEKGRLLELANKHKSQFLANMSHELRTPLNAILGYSELILDNIYGEVPDKVREILVRLEKNGRHLLGLINDVLDLSKIESGSIKLSIADYSMNEAAQAAVSAVGSLASEKKLKLITEVQPGLPRAKGDERRTIQVLLNLLGNAIKFTDEGEVRLKVTAADGRFEVSVADTGPGIAASEQSKIFDEFHQADVVRISKKGGTGLGLAITKRIIELQGGQIWVVSTPGKGSTFFFSLPVHVVQREEAS